MPTAPKSPPSSKSPKSAPKSGGRSGGAKAPPLFEVRASPIAGLGVFAARRIRKGTRIIEYLGERISSAEADERFDDDAMAQHHTVLFAVDEDTVIDAAVGGNDARFINHACSPNCEAIDEGGRIFIEAIADIPPGAELLYDYSLTRDEPWDDRWAALYACRCGSPGCRGTILKSPVPPARRRARGRGTEQTKQTKQIGRAKRGSGAERTQQAKRGVKASSPAAAAPAKPARKALSPTSRRSSGAARR